MRIASLLVDFDGTACPVDVAGELCVRFAADGWEAYDQAVRDGELTLRAAIDHQTTMLLAAREEMLDFVLSRYSVAPTFVRLARWAENAGLSVAVVSDGFGFYIRPMLAAAGLDRVPVLANRLTEDAAGRRLLHPHAHAECVGCGTCKMRAVLDYRKRLGQVAFVGEGASDRYAAIYADVVFAKDRLVDLCRQDGVDFLPWSTFDDVRETLLAPDGSTRRHSAPTLCPGWQSAS